MPTIPVIPDETVTSEKRCYHGVHVVLNFHKEDGVDRKEDQADVYPHPDEEEMEDMILDNERDCHWRMVFEDTDGGVDDKRWDVYTNEK